MSETTTVSAPERFVSAYIEAALWSSSDGEAESLEGEELSDKARAEMRADCDSFWGENVNLLGESGLSQDQAGHDFWLTRNHHGAGFWDRGLPGDTGKRLTDAAHAHGSVDLYIGDDGLVYAD